MKNPRLVLAAAVALAFALPAGAQEYAGIEGLYSSDGDGTDVMKTSLDLDLRHADGEHYQGLSLEVARFLPPGQDAVEQHRLYYRFAGGQAWKWSGRVGSDGHAIIGRAAIHNESPRRQEYFVEREIIETPMGLGEGLYSTLLGGAFDLPLGERDVLTTTVAAQDFDGENLRLHVRGKFIHVLSPKRGLSAQLRLRYFHDSHPHESDYFAPGWYAQAMPTLQLRQFHGGWRYSVAAGYGAQRQAGESWRPARMFEASITSPETARDWSFQAAFLYTNTPSSSGLGYDYRQLSVSLGHSFR